MQLLAWDSSPKWPIVCRVRYKTLLTQLAITYRQTSSSTFGTSSPADAVMHKQSLDRPSVALICEEQASLRTAVAPHSGNLFHAVRIASCGLCLDDESVRLRWVCNLEPTFMSRLAVALKSTPTVRLPSFDNELPVESPPTKPSITSQGRCVPTGGRVTKKPVGLPRQDSERPDDMTLIHFLLALR